MFLSKLFEGGKELWRAEFPVLLFRADPNAFRSREFAKILARRVTWIEDIVIRTRKLIQYIDLSLELINQEVSD